MKYLVVTFIVFFAFLGSPKGETDSAPQPSTWKDRVNEHWNRLRENTPSLESTANRLEKKVLEWKKTAQEKWKILKEEEEEESLDSFFDEELEDLLSTELVTIASRQAQTTDEVPNIIGVITKEEIRNSGARTLGEALQLVPGINVSFPFLQSSDTNLNTEGIVVRGGVLGGSRHVLYMIDGQRMNDLQSGGISSIFSFVPLYNVERIELIRGLGSARYGTGAFAGVVNIITQKGTDLRGKEIGASAHSHGGGALQFLAGEKIGSFSASIHGMLADEDGESHDFRGEDGRKRTYQDGRELSTLTLNLEYEQLSFRFNHYSQATDPLYTESYLNSENNRLTDSKGEATLLGLSYEWKLPNGSLLLDLKHSRFTTRYSRYKSKLSEFAGFLNNVVQNDSKSESKVVVGPGEQGIYRGRVADDLRLEWNLQWLHHFQQDHFLELGLVGIDETLIENSLLNNSHLSAPHNGVSVLSANRSFTKLKLVRGQTRHIHGFYLQDNWKINSVFSLYMGGRYDDYSDFGNTANPRLGLVFRLTDQQVFKILYGTAFRAPAFNEQYMISTLGDGVFENKLGPEYSKWNEISYQYGISKKYKFKTSIYRGFFDDLIYFATANDEAMIEDPNAQLENVIELKSQGIESEFRVEFRPQHNLSFNVSHSFLEIGVDGNIDKDFNDFLSPKTMSNLIYNYPLKEWFNANTSISYRSERYLGKEGQSGEKIKLPATTKGNVHIVINPPQVESLEISMGGKNVTDVSSGTTTLSSASFGPGKSSLPERGRELTIAIKYTF